MYSINFGNSFLMKVYHFELMSAENFMDSQISFLKNIFQFVCDQFDIATM